MILFARWVVFPRHCHYTTLPTHQPINQPTYLSEMIIYKDPFVHSRRRGQNEGP